MRLSFFFQLLFLGSFAITLVLVKYLKRRRPHRDLLAAPPLFGIWAWDEMPIGWKKRTKIRAIWGPVFVALTIHVYVGHGWSVWPTLCVTASIALCHCAIALRLIGKACWIRRKAYCGE